MSPKLAKQGMDKYQTGMYPIIKHQTGMYTVIKHQMGMHQMGEHKTGKRQMGPRLHQRHVGDPRHTHQCPRQDISNTSRDLLEILFKKNTCLSLTPKSAPMCLQNISDMCEPEFVQLKLQPNYNSVSRALHFPLSNLLIYMTESPCARFEGNNFLK